MTEFNMHVDGCLLRRLWPLNIVRYLTAVGDMSDRRRLSVRYSERQIASPLFEIKFQPPIIRQKQDTDRDDVSNSNSTTMLSFSLIVC